jgi:hypothetical protein
MIVATEVRNIPQAVKETLILLTPAGALAFPFMLTLLFRNRGQHEPEPLLQAPHWSARSA